MSAISSSSPSSFDFNRRFEAMQKALNETTADEALSSFRTEIKENENPVHQMVAIGAARNETNPSQALRVYDLMLTCLRIRQQASQWLGMTISIPIQTTMAQKAFQAITSTFGVTSIPAQMQPLFDQALPELNQKTRKFADSLIDATLNVLQENELLVRALEILKVQTNDPQFNHKWVERIVIPEIQRLTTLHSIDSLMQA